MKVMTDKFQGKSVVLTALVTAVTFVANVVSTSSAARAAEPAAQIATMTKEISPESLKKYSSIMVKVNEDGKDKLFKGVPLRTLLKEMLPGSLASMPDWKALAKKTLVMEVLGDDGYPGLVTAAEVAINESGDRFILATEENGKPIATGVRMICKLDEFHVRWVHSIASLHIKGIQK